MAASRLTPGGKARGDAVVFALAATVWLQDSGRGLW
jgi:hypothetical protein